MADDVFHMVDLEEKIASDASGELRDELCSDLVNEQAALKQRIDQGLPPDEYEKAQRLTAALESARKVVQSMWTLAHRNSS